MPLVRMLRAVRCGKSKRSLKEGCARIVILVDDVVKQLRERRRSVRMECSDVLEWQRHRPVIGDRAAEIPSTRNDGVLSYHLTVLIDRERLQLDEAVQQHLRYFLWSQGDSRD